MSFEVPSSTKSLNLYNRKLDRAQNTHTLRMGNTHALVWNHQVRGEFEKWPHKSIYSSVKLHIGENSSSRDNAKTDLKFPFLDLERIMWQWI